MELLMKLLIKLLFRLPLRFFQWLFVGLTGLLFLTLLASGQILSALCLLAALVLILPPSEPFLKDRFPVLNKGIIKAIVWVILFFIAMSSVGDSLIGLSEVTLCTQPQQGTCAQDTKVLFSSDKPQTLYLSAKPKNVNDRTEFKLALKNTTEPGQESTLETTTVKATVKDKQLLLEIKPQALSAGSYQLSVLSDRKGFVTQTKTFRVWDAELTALAICTQPQQSQCKPNVTALVKHPQTLYVSALSKQLKSDTNLKWTLKYTSEPGKTSSFNGDTTTASVKDDRVLLAIAPQDLPVGTYQLSFAANPTILVTETKEFTVWDAEQDAQARLGTTLKSSIARVNTLRLCDRSGKPIPTQTELSEPTTVALRKDFCPKNETRFKTSATALGFSLDSASVTEATGVKIVWKYMPSGGSQSIVASESIKRLSPRSVGLDYTLTSSSGFPAGNYELLIGLQTKNAKPIYRQFTVQ